MTALYIALGISWLLVVWLSVKLHKEQNAHDKAKLMLVTFQADRLNDGPLAELLEWLSKGSDRSRALDFTRYGFASKPYSVRLRRSLKDGSNQREAESGSLADAIEEAAGRVDDL